MSRAFFFFCICCVFAPALAGAAQVALAPHTATYDVRMVKSRAVGGGILNISGTLTYTLHAACNGGWSSTHAFDLLYEYADSPSLKVKNTFASFEGADVLDFSALRTVGEEVDLDLRGHASVLQATYTRPEDTPSHPLPPGTVFPLRHLRAILEAAHKGQTLHTAPVFEGSDTKGARLASAVIGRPLAPRLNTAAHISPARQVRVAFFSMNEEEDGENLLPEYEMTATLHDNGVISDALIEYKDFSVRQTLKKITFLPAQTCTP